ncbi:hypothetical protein ZOSMA_143G00160 [Zostera marina]|uniref:DUF1985 domain-containing protein n=1 Tax=Zostera marina TaxID=29655 RepID=A0A0K9PXQ6_ZOSMR|nr:hypothetical protein ZOSMA_143G00160 [Zostera marina]
MKPKAKPISEWTNKYSTLDVDMKRDVVSLTMSVILEKKKEMNDDDEDDIVRLWIIFLFITILGCKNSYRIGKKMLDYVDNLGYLEEYNWAAYIREVLFLKMEICRDSVLRRRKTDSASKEYLDGCILVLMLYKHTMIAKSDDVYADFEPYFKKWGGDVIVLRTSLADLRASEVFPHDIPLAKRMSIVKDMEADLSEKDTSNSDEDDDGSDSTANSGSSDSNDAKKKKKMIAKGKKPLVEGKKYRIIQGR